MANHKVVIEHNGEKYDYARIMRITGFAEYWVSKQVKKLRGGLTTMDEILSKRQVERGCFYGADGTRYTPEMLVELCPGLKLKTAKQRIQYAGRGQISEEQMLAPAHRNSDIYDTAYRGVVEQYTPEQRKTMAEMAEQIYASVDKMDKYYPPLF